MEFLGVGYQEILVILVLMLVVVGPERLPQVAFQVGRAVREMQKYARAVRDEFGDEMKYLEDQYNTVRGDFDQARQELQQQQQQLDGEMKRIDTDVKQAAREIDQSVSAEMKKQGGSNVVPISSAGSPKKPARPVRPGERASSSNRPVRPSAPKRTGASATSTTKPSSAAVKPKSRDGDNTKPPLVF